MKKALDIFFKCFDFIEEGAIVLLTAFMVFMNFANVVSRYCFSNSFSFTEELTIMAFVWVTMLGFAAGYKRCAHLGMSYVVEHFPRKGQAFFALFSMVCSLVMLVILIQYGIQMVQGQIMLNAKTPALQLPACVQGLSIPVGGAFMAIRSLQAGINEFIRLYKSEEKEEGGKK